MELQHLKYVYEVARTGSFTSAAKAIGISQPALSKMVKAVEEEFGVQLFERRRSGAVTTEIGAHFIRHCEAIFEEYRLAQELLAEKRDLVSGHLRIAASDTVTHHLLPDLLGEFCSRYPGIDITLHSGQSGDLLPRLLNGVMDVGLFYNRPTQGPFVVKRLKWIEFALIVPPHLKLPKTNVIHFLNETLRYIGPIQIGGFSNTPILPLYRKLGLNPTRYIETNHQESPKEFVHKGLGYTILPRYSVAEEIKNGKVQEVRLKDPIGLYLYLIVREGRLSRLAELFQDVVVRP